MNRNILAAAAVIVVLVAFAAWEFLQNASRQTELDALHQSHERWSSDYRQQGEQFKNTVVELQQKLKDAQNQLTQSRSATVAVTVDAPLTQAQPAKVANLFTEKANQAEMRLLTAQAKVKTHYAPFIATLKLAPQVEKILEQRIQEVLILEAELAQKMVSGEISSAEMKKYDAVGEIRKIIADYTNTQQQLAFAEYQTQLPARDKAEIQGLMNVMLYAQEPGLSDASRTLLSSVVADNMITSGMPAALWSDPVKRYQGVEAQLQGRLPDDQMKIVKEYLQRQIQMARMNQATR